MVLDSDGNVVERHHYLPFGQERPVEAPTTINSRAFTGHERDSENGLDYMLARYYSSSLGRFMAVDPGDDTDLEDPQSWNKYAYVRNNPLKTIDPRGTAGEPSQAQLNQMAAQATMQQLEPQLQAMEAADQAQKLETVGAAVCEAAPGIGQRAQNATIVLVAAGPETAGESLPLAGATALIAVSAKGAALVCNPTTENKVDFGVALVGLGTEYATAKALSAAPVSILAREAVPAVTALVSESVAKQAVSQTTAMMCP